MKKSKRMFKQKPDSPPEAPPPPPSQRKSAQNISPQSPTASLSNQLAASDRSRASTPPPAPPPPPPLNDIFKQHKTLVRSEATDGNDQDSLEKRTPKKYVRKSKKSVASKKTVSFANSSGDSSDAYLSDSSGEAEGSAASLQPASSSFKLPFKDRHLRKAKKKLKGTQTINMTRTDGFDVFGVTDYYPLERIQTTFNRPQDFRSLDLTGVDQLTDLFFKQIPQLPSLTNLTITGCLHITDQGIKWAREVFPALEKITLKGCRRVTDVSLMYLMGMASIKHIDCSAADVGVVFVAPDYAGSAKLLLQGCPVFSPVPKMVDLKVHLTANNGYFKDLSKQSPDPVCKRLIVTSESVSSSLLETLIQGREGLYPWQPVGVLMDHQPPAAKKKLNLLECPLGLLDLFACDCTSFILPYNSSDATEICLEEVFSTVVQIRAKFTMATFLLVGVTEKAGVKTTPAALKDALTKRLKTFTNEITAIGSGITSKINSSNLDFREQQMAGKLFALSDSLGGLETDIVIGETVGLAQKEGLPVLEKNLVMSAKISPSVATIYERLPQAFSDLVASVGVSPGFHSETGVVTRLIDVYKSKMGEKRAIYRKCLEVMHKKGRILYIRTPEPERENVVVTDLVWLAKLINKVMQGQAAEGQVFCVKPETPVLKQSALDEGLDAVLKDPKQKLMARDLICKIMPEMLTEADSEEERCLIFPDALLESPPVPVSHFVDSGKTEETQTVVCNYTVPWSVPSSLLSRLVMSAVIHKGPAIMWREGLVIQDTPVVVYLNVAQVTSSKNRQTEIKLSVQTLDTSGKNLKEKRPQDALLWNTLERYEVAIEYWLFLHSTFYKKQDEKEQPIKKVKGSKATRQGRGTGVPVPTFHRYLKGTKCLTSCDLCDLSLTSVKALWHQYSALHPDFSSKVLYGKDVARKGCWTSFPGIGEMAGLRVLLSPYELSTLDLIWLGSGGFQIRLNSQYHVDTALELNLIPKNSSLKVLRKGSDTAEEKVLSGQAELDLGETVSISVAISENKAKLTYVCQRGGDVLGQVEADVETPLLLTVRSREAAILIVDCPLSMPQDDNLIDSVLDSVNAPAERKAPSSSAGAATCDQVPDHVGRLMKDMKVKLRATLSQDFPKASLREWLLLPAVLDERLMRHPSLNSLWKKGEQALYAACGIGPHSPVCGYPHLLDREGVAMQTVPKMLPETDHTLRMALGAFVLDLLDNETFEFIPENMTNLLSPDAMQLSMKVIHGSLVRLLRYYVANLWTVLATDTELARWLQTCHTTESAKITQIIEHAKPETTDPCRVHFRNDLCGQALASVPMDIFANNYHLICILDVSNNRIAVLPTDFFARFKNLMSLNLSQNLLERLPEGIGACKRLTTILLSENRLGVLPADFDGCFKVLKKLDISHNPFVNIPQMVYAAQNLVVLEADHIILLELKEDVANWKKLTKLSLAGNALQGLPEAFATLLGLTSLDLSGVRWYEDPQSSSLLGHDGFVTFFNKYPLFNTIASKERDQLFTECDEEEEGALNSKGIKKLNSKLYAMFPRLQAKGGIPRQLLSLKNLKMLDLSHQQLLHVKEEITSFPGLVDLSVAHNPHLESISGEASTISTLKALHLKGCPSLKTPPKEIVSRGFQAVMGFLRRLQMGSVECKRTKLMMVGLGGAGKTSLVGCLTEGSRPQWENDMEGITDGIDIKNWTVRHGTEEVTFGVWDFAGQTVYYNTHQFFLSNRAVYLLVWNIRLGYEHAGLDFWLSSIACHAPKAPILIVGSHKDQVEKYWLPVEEMQRRYPQVMGFHAISCFTGEGLVDLKSQILEVALQQKYMGEQIPDAWLKFESKMLNAKQSKQDTLAWRTVETFAVECGIYETNEVMQAVQFLHDLGSVQHFQNELLKSRVVINPQWIVDAMACVVSVRDTPIKDGRLYHKDIGQVWQSFDATMHDWLLRLTEEFNLTFPLKDEAVNVVPCLLPATEPQVDWPDVADTPGYRESKMIYHFDYLPAGLFNRAQVRLYQLCDQYVIWKKGSLIQKNGHMGIMKQVNDTTVQVRVQGPRPENLFFVVHEVFEGLIAESFHGVTYDYFVPCLDRIKAGATDPCMFPASKIHRASELKAPFLQCDKYFHTISLHELHAQMPPDSGANFDLHLEKSLRDLDDLKDDLTFDVFMVYCKADIPQSGQEGKKTPPKKIYDDLTQDGYRVWFTADPSKFDLQQMVVTMREAKVVMICMSNHFVADESSSKIFYYVRDNLQKKIQLVVLGTGWEWKESTIGMHLSTDVFVNMLDINRYPSKLAELLSSLKGKVYGSKEVTCKWPSCFISYCWSNSQEAVKRGTRADQESLGWGDPRKFKAYLEEQNIACWMDVDRVGKGSLFEEIAEGLRHAKVIVVCVSDEYARSKNCQVEFRFAAITLKLPMILAVVGTGYKWEITEVGMLAMGWPKVNFQYDSPESFSRLLNSVRSLMPQEEEEEKKQEEDVARQQQTASPTNSNQMAFQELLELAQRKFLRQVSIYADDMETMPYPRLLVLDYLSSEEKKSLRMDGENTTRAADTAKEDQAAGESNSAAGAEAASEQVDEDSDKPEEETDRPVSDEPSSRSGDTGSDSKAGSETLSGDSAVKPTRPSSADQGSRSARLLRRQTTDLLKVPDGVIEEVDEEEKEKQGRAQMDYCVRYLCEYEEGWHSSSIFQPLTGVKSNIWDDFLDDIAPYMARILAVLKHTALDLPILTTAKGDQLRVDLIDKCGLDSEYKEEYCSWRKKVMSTDQEGHQGGLARCLLPNGKILWLCPEHSKQDRVTVLSSDYGVADTEVLEEDTWTPDGPPAETTTDIAMLVQERHPASDIPTTSGNMSPRPRPPSAGPGPRPSSGAKHGDRPSSSKPTSDQPPSTNSGLGINVTDTNKVKVIEGSSRTGTSTSNHNASKSNEEKTEKSTTCSIL